MGRYVVSEMAPVDGLVGGEEGREGGKEDEELLKQAKQVAESIYHPTGTCKMGNFLQNSERVIVWGGGGGG